MRVNFSNEDFKVGLATSVVLYGFDGDDLKILIAEKVGEPYSGAKILPSTVVHIDEDPEDVAIELMRRITGSADWPIEILNAFAEVYRNPSGRVVNVAYYGTLQLNEALSEDLLRSEYKWVNVNDIPPLAFDHNKIVDYSRERLKRRVKRRPIGFSLLPKEFTMNQIQRLYECALGRDLDKRNFRRKLLKSELLLETDHFVRSSAKARRPSALYKFDEKKYRSLTLRGYDFVYQ
ncbi:MAG: NUDIX hydrolase [Bacteroidetes bacterium]|nr:MAG: NUDIX hydrolase [Bacteroidota bacterium]